MKTQSAIILALSATVSAHGVVVKMLGENGVEMPGLTVADGTPRDCTSNGCGSQADTAIIRDREIRQGGSPLGRTQGGGPVDAAVMIRNFMGEGEAPSSNATGVGEEDNIPSNVGAGRGASRGASRFAAATRGRSIALEEEDEETEDIPPVSSSNFVARQLGNLFKGLGGLGGGGGVKALGGPETMVKATLGEGASSGLPTVGKDGIIKMTFRQINQDGAGPMSADVDGTSGGTKADAFQQAEVVKDVPGLGIQGLSLATATEFPLEVKMPAGTTCEATVAGVKNVCVVRVRNGAVTGPFGGSAAFTQSPEARKRAIAYRLRKRMSLDNRN
ncbi:hypothetical protein MCOR27_000065 [Pyricularia oryzae]|uniref:Cell surface protein n=1 Tax=Pyricularia grisea TaxID=148305 RepID=A0ABQ8NUH2_PYRGI|nr:hypothetical protein MCOR01_006753 [Pyricularia oryzae]KAI6302323.1 hypothetical protein MCOR33_002352 [Pyricularia grisea]KAH9436072.1 hypothetical protein MCOR02_004981 [Pyricularia oryzae]KAI6251856.1 hypothetical protein MCOR19_011517 [Pyricularia oryzae]KAI6287364.1 hypothetical protein MCOR26_000616 [Pyricularia oryzae]